MKNMKVDGDIQLLCNVARQIAMLLLEKYIEGGLEIS